MTHADPHQQTQSAHLMDSRRPSARRHGARPGLLHLGRRGPVVTSTSSKGAGSECARARAEGDRARPLGTGAERSSTRARPITTHRRSSSRGSSPSSRGSTVCSSATAAPRRTKALIKLPARKWGKVHKGGAHEIITTTNGFHGRTLATMAATGKAGLGHDVPAQKSPGSRKCRSATPRPWRAPSVRTPSVSGSNPFKARAASSCRRTAT